MTDEWTAAKQRYPVGSSLSGAVEEVAPFGIFVSAEGVRSYGVVADLAGMHKDAADDTSVIWPEVGEPVSGVVVQHSEHNEQLKIRLT